MVLSTAAKAYTNFIKASGSITGHEIVHLFHPRPVLWRDLARAIAEEFDLPMVLFTKWFKALHTLMESEGIVKDPKTLAKPQRRSTLSNVARSCPSLS
ncbi:hypothetical protein BKA70DRAFT_1303063 [Coprinopsis sp. MPI-PUGE-AT-0042]|nr:hypothetical protein BKA70DRAFT_1303063 [Coprinopsis sp. MPI-PUGE-AT-0042]